MAQLSKFIFTILFSFTTVFSATEEGSQGVLVARAFREVPSEPLLTLEQQEDLFVKAYQEVGPQNVDPLKTPVPGLAAAVRQHYAFTRDLVQDSATHLELLSQFWQKMAEIIDENRLTVRMMKDSAMQLAFLLTDHQVVSGKARLEQNLNPFFKDSRAFYPLGSWKDIDTYTRFSKSMNFRCSAVLCSKTGELSLNQFVRNFCGRDFPISLSALSYCSTNEEGPHGGRYLPASFLDHDYNHEQILCVRSGVGLGKFSRGKDFILEKKFDFFKSLMTKIYGSPDNKEFNTRALFWLFHENLADFLKSESEFLQDRTVLEEDSCSAFLPEEKKIALLKEDIFLYSERGRFLLSVASAFKIEKANALSMIVRKGGGSDSFHSQFPFEFGPYVEIDRDHAMLTMNVHLAQEEDGMDSSSLVLKEKIGSFTVDLSFVPTEKKKISNLSSVQWDPDIPVDSSVKERTVEQIKQWQNQVEDSFRLSWSVDEWYAYNYLDDERLLLDPFYGKTWLPESDRENPSIVKRLEYLQSGMNQFWVDFYHQNKHLFSDKPLNQ